MRSKMINLKRTKEYDNGEIISFIFEGALTGKNYDEEKVNELIDNFVNKRISLKNMSKNVQFIRTILRDFEERRLIISRSNYNISGDSETVCYEDGDLVLYRCDSAYIENGTLLHVQFEKGRGLEVNFRDSENDVVDSLERDTINELFMEQTNHICSLKEARAIDFDRDSKTLVEIYKLFYNENPDFSSENINDKVQAMMSILAMYGISLGDSYSSFILRGSEKIPSSINLQYCTDKLMPFGKSINDYDDVKLSDWAAKMIKVVGETIREDICDEDDMVKSLKTISKVIYGGRYNLSQNSDVQEISEFMDCSRDEVEATIKLVRRIDEKNNNNR